MMLRKHGKISIGQDHPIYRPYISDQERQELSFCKNCAFGSKIFPKYEESLEKYECPITGRNIQKILEKIDECFIQRWNKFSYSLSSNFSLSMFSFTLYLVSF